MGALRRKDRGWSGDTLRKFQRGSRAEGQAALCDPGRLSELPGCCNREGVWGAESVGTKKSLT